MTPPGRQLVSIRNLSKIFMSASMPPRRAVDDVSFSVGEGEFVLIKGPSGSGKTTILSMIGCLMKPTSGSITIRSADVCAMDQKALTEFRLKHIGFVFQGFRLVDYLTVLENVMLPFALNGTGKRAALDRAVELLTATGLGDRLQSDARELSGGEKQRVAVARALATSPFLVLADEPTGSLDSAGGRNVIALLSDLSSRKGTTTIVVSHDERIVRYADRVLVIEDGRLS